MRQPNECFCTISQGSDQVECPVTVDVYERVIQVARSESQRVIRVRAQIVIAHRSLEEIRSLPNAGQIDQHNFAARNQCREFGRRQCFNFGTGSLWHAGHYTIAAVVDDHTA